MSILIKDMELPKSCSDCPMLDWDLDYIKCKVTGRHFKVKEEPFRARRVDDCPLVPVPPHGDLITREWLIDIALHLMNTAKNDDIANGVKWLWQYIIDAPTIIPAEPFNNLSKPCKDDDDIPICAKASPASLGIYKKAEEGE